MNFLLIGYGKMGKTIEGILKERGHNIVNIIDLNNREDLINIDPSTVDVAIEFTQPSSAYDNIKVCLDKGIRVVSGTTGWLDKKEEVEAATKAQNTAFFYASNYSLGVNIFFALNKKLAEMMSAFNKEYKSSMVEIHHTQKLDAPSGTAITLAEGVIEKFAGVDSWTLKGEDEAKANGIEIEALREPDVPGTHEVTYESEIDRIDIKHTAHSRKGFALGAVLAGEWLHKKEGIFGMEDMLAL
ncbi:4-hydroxy-tetrahydrodipicolinate reductase [Flammeovirga yaeyamensis]|uniref:4-hydroxy-tetrahydrodipicolinate reductase n=1 Tax=Flammeovirga yaeyamensis TaxID=367791 RepID=A0AAX1N1A0_9BACT|nr:MULTISPECIES: 4-hydroxy-tetrahydrodipicolinate reductase [Flammeovirga]ANQ47485.1 4-hydroxy-tetrahydrodipicolinate reductase [Flammeovirga sp. MY04]MBB3698525.1 4-hydroxy-tetrahydrodipicolinate reductase [Flammeovirga yaeyamensis]NMF34126.1 4-hydroxy-tetrahydrodipicolinate reductase [Flammeovirga yaeyamensis]QWG01112.1 4-hydroxy-tetrahydrodipicolinate reductase [Flammeovirga yaeyamensis]